jgi:folate-binding protein YgfZ
LETLRIEAGIPASGPDLDKVLPAETGQLQRAVNFHKGCYLGQEVIERMRSRGGLARRLVRLRVDDGSGISLPSTLTQSEREVGRVTSLIRHPVADDWIGLGYLRTSVKEPNGITTNAPLRSVQILD